MTSPPPISTSPVTPEQRVGAFGDELAILTERHTDLAQAVGVAEAAEPLTRLDIFHGYMPIVIVAFVISLLTTPIMRDVYKRQAQDRPNRHARRAAPPRASARSRSIPSSSSASTSGCWRSPGLSRS